MSVTITDSLSVLDITSEQVMLEFTPTMTTAYRMQFNLIGIAASAATYTIRVYYYSTKIAWMLDSVISCVKPDTALTRWIHSLNETISVQSAVAVRITIQSNAADSAITSGTFTCIDPTADGFDENNVRITALNHVLSAAIVTVTSNSVFTVDKGQPIDDFYNGLIVMLTDITGYATAGVTCKVVRFVTDYDQATKTITINEDVPWTLAAGDLVRVLPHSSKVNTVLSGGGPLIGTSDIVAACGTALNTEIPGSPTAESVNALVKSGGGGHGRYP